MPLCLQCNNTFLTSGYELPPHIWNNIRAHILPTTAEACQIPQRILAAECDLVRYQTWLRATLQMLERQEAQVKKYISGYRCYLNTPSRRFPTEILLFIFKEVASSVADRYFTMTLSISLVCSRWRNIALSEPSLWRNIYVGEGCSPDINTALVHLYSKHSVKGPLRVAANVTGEDEGYRYDPALSSLYHTDIGPLEGGQSATSRSSRCERNKQCSDVVAYSQSGVHGDSPHNSASRSPVLPNYGLSP
ncbi:uncharacterized protein BT62DRAFT_694838 [Guyanagaster necrorhizus]|uniref:F-box domain-containing protein n=1 Tax=Guyanagaster necrorhizus TaxID=856835 RepID=A0A9P8ALI7_9AGAR|nr:uncharacterized protein BT62DRAFT_694838 [Guyanagaster necrorhizus MCA 3950]KAG7439686.1 hypothetical protein BT62DRAFT_694838 [Guyanagaster necrorhizus MCA 3950]